MTPTPKLTSGVGGGADGSVPIASPTPAPGPFVLNLCSSTTPMALPRCEQPELRRFSFFVSRRFEEGRERFRLHMGYFTTLAEAEEWLGAVRDIYPGAWAGEAPGKKLRERAAAAAAAQAQHARGPQPSVERDAIPTLVPAAPATAAVTTGSAAKPTPSGGIKAPHAASPTVSPAALPAGAVNVPTLRPASPTPSVPSASTAPKAAPTNRASTPSSAPPSAPRSVPALTPTSAPKTQPAVPTAHAAPRPSPAKQQLAAGVGLRSQNASSTAPRATSVATARVAVSPSSSQVKTASGVALTPTRAMLQGTMTARPQAPSQPVPPRPQAPSQPAPQRARQTGKSNSRSSLPHSNVREVLAALSEPSEETTGETRLMPAPVLPKPNAEDDATFTDTQVLKLLESRRADGNDSTGLDAETGAISLLRPDDTGTRRALKQAVTDNAPVWFAVQLQWSVQPVELVKVPPLAIFSAYTLYTVEGSRDGRKWYGLRLGFFSDAISAKQVAYYVRSEFGSVAVVPVSPKERARATDDEQAAAAVAAPEAAPRATTSGEFKLIGVDEELKQMAARPLAAKPGTKPPAAARTRAPGRVGARERRG